jgi:hypothetical protein
LLVTSKSSPSREKMPLVVISSILTPKVYRTFHPSMCETSVRMATNIVLGDGCNRTDDPRIALMENLLNWTPKNGYKGIYRSVHGAVQALGHDPGGRSNPKPTHRPRESQPKQPKSNTATTTDSKRSCLDFAPRCSRHELYLVIVNPKSGPQAKCSGSKR